jgi:hypothetical protein
VAQFGVNLSNNFFRITDFFIKNIFDSTSNGFYATFVLAV